MAPDPTSVDNLLPADRRAMIAGIGGLAAGALLAGSRTAHAGPLNPPAGPVASTGKTLTEVEPRIAINATNTPGDADSVFKITQPGSYYLTGNIAGVTGKHGLEIAASQVTVDLNGFSLIGGTGTRDGISAGGGLTDISIRNGTIRNWAQYGIRLTGAFYSSLLDLRVRANALDGIAAGSHSSIRSCVVNANGASGIFANAGCLIELCHAISNATDGVFVTSAGVISRCSAYLNSAAGIRSTGLGYLGIIACSSLENVGPGIRVNSGTLVRGNTLAANGRGSTPAAGILVDGVDNRIEDNNSTTNGRGIEVVGSGNIIIRNTCSGNTINWAIVANNVYGPIIDRTAPASAAVNGNAAPDASGSTHPNANFTF